VQPYKGTKSVVISTVSWIGGKNAFLGWAYVGAASVFVLLAIAGTARHLIKPRCAPSRSSDETRLTFSVLQTPRRYVIAFVESVTDLTVPVQLTVFYYMCISLHRKYLKLLRRLCVIIVFIYGVYPIPLQRMIV
jgi:hypothetical protein